jgi:hypothetical protein
MVKCILTIDYETYGNGEGILRELDYEPARGLKELLDQVGNMMLVFVEAAEFK